jgi:hypothetical protein
VVIPNWVLLANPKSDDFFAELEVHQLHADVTNHSLPTASFVAEIRSGQPTPNGPYVCLSLQGNQQQREQNNTDHYGNRRKKALHILIFENGWFGELSWLPW